MDGVNASMRDIVAQLKDTEKKFASAVRKQIRAGVTAAGADIVEAVRSEASWSGRIPAATTIRPNFTARSAGVRVSVNRRKAPHARTLEFGNYDASPGAATFKHPVFGRRRLLGRLYVTAKQNKRPFFFKATQKQTPAMEQQFLDAIDTAVRAAGFK